MQIRGADIEEPFRMTPDQVGVTVRALRFKPQPELQAARPHIGREGLKPLGEFRDVNSLPVTHAGTKIVSGPAPGEPSRVEHKVLKVQLGRAIYLAAQRSLGKVTADAEPMVV